MPDEKDSRQEEIRQRHLELMERLQEWRDKRFNRELNHYWNRAGESDMRKYFDKVLYNLEHIIKNM